MQIPDLPDTALQIAFVIWIFVGMIRPILSRAGLSDGWISDVTPLLSLALCITAAIFFVTPDIDKAIIIGGFMAITSFGFHDVYEHYTQKSEIGMKAGRQVFHDHN